MTELLSEKSLQKIDIRELKGVGPKTAAKFERIGISTALDLLFHLPIRYEDRTQLTSIGALCTNTYALFEGEIRASGIIRGRRSSYMCKLQQDMAVISLRLFHFSAAQTKGLTKGATLRCYGEIRPGRNGLECFHPEYRIIDIDDPPALDSSLTPVYPSTEGLHQASFRNLLAQVLPLLDSHTVSDYIPADIMAAIAGPKHSLGESLLALHAPAKDQLGKLESYQKRLALEELLAHHMSMLRLRARIRQLKAPALRLKPESEKLFMQGLGFTFTRAQQAVYQEIRHDLEQATPTLRLVQGDVGSGKTVVAAMAVLQAISSDHQAVLMAPTEILVEQHWHAFSNWFEPLGIAVALLSGQQTAKQRRESLALIESGAAQLIVGTHAVIQDAVNYNRLGLIVVDEQHRFGVEQRLTLRRKAIQSGICPHQIIMTATPIPRTLAMAAYADLDVSVIDELPPGRTPVTTTVLEDSQRARVMRRVEQACQQGRQAYWVCTLVEESEVIQCQDAENTATELAKELPDVQIGLVHGRMKPKEKAEVMQRFKAGELQLLVATTVIEVGVDVPNASLMIIENSERLGLSQIHQLRGRVGRGSEASHCVLLYQKPLSNNGKQRLETLRSSSDGFYIAEQDLLLRGPGEMLGTRQTGMLQFRIADLERDADLLEIVDQIAADFSRQHADNIGPLIKRWLGDASNYGNA